MLTEQQQIDLIEALGFYADPASYFAIGVISDPPSGRFADDFSYVDEEWGERPGKTAREALAKAGIVIE